MFSIINVRELDLFEPQILVNGEYAKTLIDDIPVVTFNHFPILLRPDLTIFEEGTLYILSKLEAFRAPSAGTLASVAQDLVAYMNHLAIDSCDFLHMPKRKAARPTYLYRFWLQEQMAAGELVPKTASRRMNVVVGFYRWLIARGMKFEHSPWAEHTAFIRFENRVGFTFSRPVTATNLSIRIPPPSSSYRDYINDGGKLKPLTPNQQSTMLKALRNIGNIEMELIFLIALCTGARLQTICTLRLGIFNKSWESCDTEIKIAAGPNTLVDTKHGKSGVLYFPTWLFEKLKIYNQSPSAEVRRRKNTSYKNPADQYLFLTKGGRPYYMGRNDPERSKVKRMPVGNAITQFIKSALIPEICRLGEKFDLQFHDLRASYGMNLVDANQEKLVTGEISYHKLKIFIKDRMWHASSDTTERYLKFRADNKFLIEVQETYENFLINLRDGIVHE